MKQGCVQNTIPSAVTVGDGILLQNPQKAAGLWFGVPTDFGVTAPVGEGIGLRLIDPQGASGLILGTPVYKVTPPIPVSPPTINSVVPSGTASLLINFTDNQTAAADNFTVKVEEVGVGPLADIIGVTSSPYTRTGLSSDTTYEVTMTATVGAEESGLSNAVQATTFASGGTFVPIKLIDFEAGVNGESAQQPGMFDSLAGNTIVTTEVPAAVGTKCARFFKAAAIEGVPRDDQAGYGTWGGAINLPSSHYIGTGDELWVSWRSRWPTGYDFLTINPDGTGTGTLKFMRLPREPNEKPLDLGCIDAVGTYWCGGPHRAYSFQGERTGPFLCAGDWNTHSPMVNYDTWIRYEWYVRMATDSSGIMRIYQDGDLLREYYGATNTAGNEIRQVWFHTWWNNADTFPVNDSYEYVDHIVICDQTSRPTNKDADDNNVIGDWT